MDDLLATLGRLGIEPLRGDHSPTEWTRHVTVGERHETAADGGARQPDPPMEDGGEAVVAAGDTVEVRFADNGARRSLRILCPGDADADSDFPDGSLVRALLGRSTHDEVPFEAEGKSRVAVVERISKGLDPGGAPRGSRQATLPPDHPQEAPSARHLAHVT